MYGIEVIILNVSGALIGHIIGAVVDDALFELTYLEQC